MKAVGPVAEEVALDWEVGKMHRHIAEVGIVVVASLDLVVGSHLHFGREGRGAGMEVRRLEGAFVAVGRFRLPLEGRLNVSC